MFTVEYLRSFKILEYAIFDFVLSFLGIYLLSPLLSKLFSKVRLNISRKSWLLLTLPLSIIIHSFVGTITPMTENFLDLKSHYLLKIFIVILTYFGLKDIKKTKKK